MGAQRQAAEFHDYPFETTDLVCDQAAAYASGSFEGRNVRKSGQLGKTMRLAQKTSRFARLYDQHDHSPQRSEFTQVAYPLLRVFSVE